VSFPSSSLILSSLLSMQYSTWAVLRDRGQAEGGRERHRWTLLCPGPLTGYATSNYGCEERKEEGLRVQKQQESKRETSQRSRDTANQPPTPHDILGRENLTWRASGSNKRGLTMVTSRGKGEVLRCRCWVVTKASAQHWMSTLAWLEAQSTHPAQ
jgi:hypothetical protein